VKVLNLQCGQAHGFEGWFGSEEDYQSQRTRGLVSCPLCGDAQIVKLPSAPRLNLGAAQPALSSPATVSDGGASSGEGAVQSTPAPTPAAASPAQPAQLQQMQAALMHAVRQVMAHTEDVGNQFADEARKMHYGEAKERGIRGQVTREESEALQDEGIEVMALPMLESLKGPLQ
jgi:hypothetical protein